MSCGSRWPSTACSAMCWWSTGMEQANAPTIAATRGAHMPAALTTACALDFAVLRLDRAHPSVADVDAGDERVRADLRPELARRRSHCVGRDVRVDVAVARHPHGAEELVVRDRRHEPPRLLGADELCVEPDRVRPRDAAAQLEQAVVARRDPERAHPLEHAELLVQLDAVPAEAHHRRRWVELRHEACRVVRGAARELSLLDEHDVEDARLGEVVRAADAGDPAADDDDPRHPRMRSPFGS